MAYRKRMKRKSRKKVGSSRRKKKSRTYRISRGGLRL